MMDIKCLYWYLIGLLSRYSQLVSIDFNNAISSIFKCYVLKINITVFLSLLGHIDSPTKNNIDVFSDHHIAIDGA